MTYAAVNANTSIKNSLALSRALSSLWRFFLQFFLSLLIWAGYYYSELNNDTSALRCFVSLNTKRDKSICMLKRDNNSSTSELQKKSSLYLDWLLFFLLEKLESIIAWLGWGCAHSDICANICDLFCLMKLLMHFSFSFLYSRN